MNLSSNCTAIVAAALLCVVVCLRTVRADLYTYSLNAPTGYGGGTLSGDITFSGNAGDPVPALNLAPTFTLTYTPPSGPAETWTQTDSINTVFYNPSNDWGGGLLGDPTLTAATIPSGLDTWAITNAGTQTLNLYWEPSPYGPAWAVRPNPTDYVYNTWSLSLQSDVPTPEPQLAGWVGLAAIVMVVGGRRARKGSRV